MLTDDDWSPFAPSQPPVAATVTVSHPRSARSSSARNNAMKTGGKAKTKATSGPTPAAPGDSRATDDANLWNVYLVLFKFARKIKERREKRARMAGVIQNAADSARPKPKRIAWQTMRRKISGTGDTLAYVSLLGKNTATLKNAATTLRVSPRSANT